MTLETTKSRGQSARMKTTSNGLRGTLTGIDVVGDDGAIRLSRGAIAGESPVDVFGCCAVVAALLEITTRNQPVSDSSGRKSGTRAGRDGVSVLLLLHNGAAVAECKAAVQDQVAADGRGAHGSSVGTIGLKGQGPIILEIERNVVAVVNESASEAPGHGATKDGEGHGNALDRELHCGKGGMGDRSGLCRRWRSSGETRGTVETPAVECARRRENLEEMGNNFGEFVRDVWSQRDCPAL